MVLYCIGVSKSCPMIGLENLCHTKLRNSISRVSTPGIFYLLFLLQVLIGSLSYFLYCDWLLRLLTQTTLQFNIYNFFSTNRHVWKWLVLRQRCPLPSPVLFISNTCTSAESLLVNTQLADKAWLLLNRRAKVIPKDLLIVGWIRFLTQTFLLFSTRDLFYPEYLITFS